MSFLNLRVFGGAGRRKQVAVSIRKANRRSRIEQDFRLEVGV